MLGRISVVKVKTTGTEAPWAASSLWALCRQNERPAHSSGSRDQGRQPKLPPKRVSPLSPPQAARLPLLPSSMPALSAHRASLARPGLSPALASYQPAASSLGCELFQQC